MYILFVLKHTNVQVISSIQTLSFSHLANIFHFSFHLCYNHHYYMCQLYESMRQLKHFYSLQPFNKGQHSSTQCYLLFQFWATSEGRKDGLMKKKTFFISMFFVFTIHFSGKTVNTGDAC